MNYMPSLDVLSCAVFGRLHNRGCWALRALYHRSTWISMILIESSIQYTEGLSRILGEATVDKSDPLGREEHARSSTRCIPCSIRMSMLSVGGLRCCSDYCLPNIGLRTSAASWVRYNATPAIATLNPKRHHAALRCAMPSSEARNIIHRLERSREVAAMLLSWL